LLRGERAISDELAAEFADAFRFVSTLHRTDAVDVEHSVGYWCDTVMDSLRKRVSAPAFGAAIVAAGDVSYISFDRWPHELAWGLIIGSRASSRPASNMWLSVLQGRIRAPVALKAYAERRGETNYQLAPALRQ
jgi:hypothetical protein